MRLSSDTHQEDQWTDNCTVNFLDLNPCNSVYQASSENLYPSEIWNIYALIKSVFTLNLKWSKNATADKFHQTQIIAVAVIGWRPTGNQNPIPHSFSHKRHHMGNAIYQERFWKLDLWAFTKADPVVKLPANIGDVSSRVPVQLLGYHGQVNRTLDLHLL